jgi:hypothetical protein
MPLLTSANEANMKRILMVLTLFFSLPFAIISAAPAAVTELRFGYAKTTNPASLPTSWTTSHYPQYVTYEYQLHQISFGLSAGEYVIFEIGMANVDGPASLLIDKIELSGPSGKITISNSGFESGSSDWSAWGSHYAEGEFTVSTEAYEGSKAGKLTLFSTGTYSIHGQVPVAIAQNGTYTLSAYTRAQEAEREIPPDAVFAVQVGNQWVYDGGVKREIAELDHFTFRNDTFKLRILQNDTEIGSEWYEVWKGYVMFWGTSAASETYQFSDGLLVAWIPGTAGESKRSLAWVLNYNTEVDLTATFLGTEQIALDFDTFEAYRFRYDYTFSGPGGTTETTYDWWFVPYIGVVKQQVSGEAAKLVSFSIAGGTVSEVSDNDEDGLLDYKELANYHTDPANRDTDEDAMPDGWEVQYGLNPLVKDATGDKDGDRYTNLKEYKAGTDPTDPGSKPKTGFPWLPLLLTEDIPIP